MVRQVTARAESSRIALIVTELVTNAVSHGEAPVFSVSWDGESVRIEVFDNGAGRPVVRPLDATATSGRGMALVDAVADRWGVEETPAGKTVWAEVGLGLGPDLGG